MSSQDLPRTPQDDVRRIDREAAAWLVVQDRGFTAAEQDAFFQWLAADPRHGEWLARHRQTWKDFNLLAEWKPEHSAEPNADLLARTVTGAPALSLSKGSRLIRWAWLGGLAAAACLALALWLTPSRTQPAVAPMSLVAQGYERRVLEDGSVVELNRGAKIEVAYTAGERRVRLEQGEANFTVAKDKDRPFVVRVAGIDVRAVGTAFNVRLGDREVHVLVTEGRVRVDDAARGASVLAVTNPGETPVLAANEQVTIPLVPPAAVPVRVATGDEISRQLAWRPEMLEFNSAPLGEVVAAFNRRGRIQLAVADAELLDLPIVASFRSDNVEGFVRLLELTSGVTVQRGDETITLRKGSDK